MFPIDLWKLSNEYSLIHAALLIASYSPDEAEHRMESELARKCPGYLPAKTALYNAVLTGTLEAAKLIREQTEYGETDQLDIHRTIIRVADLDAFVKSRGMVCEYFERPAASNALSFSAKGSFFSKKLDAANRAWAAVTSDPSRLAGRSPKQALEKRLKENAAELGLLNKDGRPNQTGIDEICKVANWKPEGGATPTTSNVALPAPQPLIRLPAHQTPVPTPTPREVFSADLDDEIPF